MSVTPRSTWYRFTCSHIAAFGVYGVESNVVDPMMHGIGLGRIMCCVPVYITVVGCNGPRCPKPSEYTYVFEVIVTQITVTLSVASLWRFVWVPFEGEWCHPYCLYTVGRIAHPIT